MTYNPEVHHRRSIRLQGYDYRNGGAYFVTLCENQHECLFGEIVDGAMRLNDIWFYDYRTNIHHTLKKKPLRYDDLTDFITCYNPLNRHKRKETWDAATNPEGRWRKFTREQIVARDKTSLDIFCLKDKSLADLDNLPEPDDLAAEIIENVEAGLNSFRQIVTSLT